MEEGTMLQHDTGRRSIRWAWLLLLTLVTVSGCGSPAVDTSRSAHDALAASASARQALDQLDRGRTTGPAARVTLDASATEIAAALSRTATVVPESARQQRELTAVRGVVASASAAVATARALLETDADPARARDLVAAAERDLRLVTRRLGPPR